MKVIAYAGTCRPVTVKRPTVVDVVKALEYIARRSA